MTAEDVKASLDRARDCAEVANYTNTVQSVEVVDDNTVKVTTATPSATLLYDLGNHGNAILPKALIDSGNDFSKNPIGTGPYQFVSWTSGVELQFKAFEDYFGGAPSIKNMTWKIIPEGSSRTISLEAGEVDFVLEVEAVDLERIKASDKLDTVTHASNIISWMNMNNERPGMDNEALRHAINSAINKEDIVTVAANGQGTVAVAQVPLGMPGYSDENADKYDPEKAKEWLAQSGVDPSTVEFPILCSSESKKRVAEVIQANLKEVLGINATIESMDLATYVSAAAEGNFVAAIGGYSANDIVSFLKGVYHSKSIGSSNQTRTNDAEIDAAIDEISVTIDPAQREQMIKDLAAKLNARSPQVPLYQGQNLRAFNAGLQGVTLNSAGMTRFEKMSWKAE